MVNSQFYWGDDFSRLSYHLIDIGGFSRDRIFTGSDFLIPTDKVDKSKLDIVSDNGKEVAHIRP